MLKSTQHIYLSMHLLNIFSLIKNVYLVNLYTHIREKCLNNITEKRFI